MAKKKKKFNRNINKCLVTREHETEEKACSISQCFNRHGKSYLTISINAIYESSNFFSADLILPAIHSGLYFTVISFPPAQLHFAFFFLHSTPHASHDAASKTPVQLT